ncbi:D-glycerate dehydrogenase [Treponema sp.]
MARPKVYVTRKIPQIGLDLLAKECDVTMNLEDKPLSRADFLKAISDVDGVLCLLTEKIDGEAFEAAAKAKGFANYAVGYDNMDVAEATKRGIPLSNTPDVLTEATADMAWALLFAAARRVVESDKVMRSGKWPGWGPMQFIGGDIQGATLGIVGAGRIGAAMARKSTGFKMKILYTDAVPNPAFEAELGAKFVSFEELTAQSDYVSVHVPLLPTTRHLFTYDVFKKMKKTAYLINTARGPIVKEDDLVRALKEGLIAGAGLDVYESEPKMADGLAQLDNVVICPHTASATVSSRNGMAVKAATNLLAMLKGERAPDCINPRVYEGK